MSQLNQRLVAAAAALLALSVFSYWNSVSRADRFESGQKFLPNLNPDEIVAVEILQGDEQVTLSRQDDFYVVEEVHDYRARNEGVNRLVRNLLDIELAKEIGSGDNLAAELGIEPPGEDTVEVALQNAAGSDMVRLRVGNRFEGGSGNYVRRLDGEENPIFLTEATVLIDSTADQFLQKEIVDVSSSDVARIDGPDFTFSTGEGESDALALERVPAGRREKTSEAGRVKNFLSRLRFSEVHLADAEEVADLSFDSEFRYELADGSGYVVSVAGRDDDRYIRISGYHTVQQVEIERDTPDEELQEKADILNRAEEMRDFNDYHGSWVYKLDSFTGEKLDLRRADLIEDEEEQTEELDS
ncbi:MAG: DUF4340 domain-containing protein [Acidobacteria bacterium]|nr:DUF4340 domain-containing protein [Acidobacteriota bacterium]